MGLNLSYNYIQIYNRQKQKCINSHLQKCMYKSMLIHANVVKYIDKVFILFINSLNKWWFNIEMNLENDLDEV